MSLLPLHKKKRLPFPLLLTQLLSLLLKKLVFHPCAINESMPGPFQ